jgi:phage protein D
VLEKIATAGQAGDKVESVSDYVALTEEEARRFGLGILKRNVDETLTASGTVIGDPRVRAHTTLKIEGVGRFDGFYYVTSAEHRLDSGGYETSFNVRRNTALAEAGSASSGQAVDLESALIEGAGSIVRLRVT